MDVDSLIELYDSDMKVLNEVGQRLNSWVGQKADLDDFFSDVKDKFHRAGFLVKVQYKVYADGTIPEQLPYIIMIEGRVKTESEFDHERQSWEVQHDVLGTDPNPGALQLDGSIRSPTQVTSFSKKQ